MSDAKAKNLDLKKALAASKMSRSLWEDAFAVQLRLCNFPPPNSEYRFHDKRRWRFDFAWPDKMVAVEIEGGIHKISRHTTGTGFTADCEKYNQAVLDGWQVLRFTSSHVKSGYALNMIEQALEI